jgi:hypothetical protein
MGFLTLVQRQRPGGFDQRRSLGLQVRVIRQDERPSLPEMRHGETGRHITGSVE